MLTSCPTGAKTIYSKVLFIDNYLNERQRIAFVGIHFEGRSVQEIADQLETSANTVYKMLHDGRKKIRAQLQALHMSEGDILALFEA